MLSAKHQVSSLEITLFDFSLGHQSSGHQLFHEPGCFLFVINCEVDQANACSSRGNNSDLFEVSGVDMLWDMGWPYFLFIHVISVWPNSLAIG